MTASEACASTTQRDRDAERGYLVDCLAAKPGEPGAGDWRSVAARALLGDDGFISAVQGRLDAHGPAAAPRPSAEVLRECAEEGLDLAAWACPALSAVPAEERDELLQHLAPVVALAERAWAAVRRAERARGSHDDGNDQRHLRMRCGRPPAP